MADIDLLLEAEKRGLLPPEKQSLLDEARKRGIVPPRIEGGEVLHDPVVSFGVDQFNNNAKPYDENSTIPIGSGAASAMNVGQGLTMGWGDELAGLLPGVDRDRYRATVDKFQRDWPKTALLGNVSGGMLLPLGGAEIAAATKAANPWLIGAGVAGLQGAVQGAGDAKRPNEMVGDATTNAALGMAVSPLMLGSTKLGGEVLGAVGANTIGKLPGVGEKFSKYLARSAVSRALDRDEIDPAKIGAALQDLNSSGYNEARVVDAGGKNTRATLDVNANLPGTTGNRLETAQRERIANRPERLDSVVDSLGNGQGRAGEVYGTWQAKKQAESAPLYKKLHQSSVNQNAQLKSQLDAAEKLGAFGTAKEIATAERNLFTLDPRKNSLSMKDLDYVKQGLDDLVMRETKPDGSITAKGRAISELRKDFIKNLDALTTDRKTNISLYKSARDAFSGPASLQDALTKGRAFANQNKTAEELNTYLSGLSDSEKDAYRIGAAEALRQKFGSQGGQTEYLNAWKNRNIREKLQAVFGDEEKYKNTLKILANENKMKEMEGIGKNSQTFAREAAAEDQTINAASDAISAGKDVASGSWIKAGLEASKRLGVPENVRNMIGDILLGKYNAADLAKLEQSYKLYKARQLGNAVTTGSLSQQAGNQARQELNKRTK